MKPIVFHLKRVFFDMIKHGIKNCEYRFTIPACLKAGSLIRFDLAYKPLSDSSAHLFATCDSVDLVPLRSCPQYVFDCFGIDSSLVACDVVRIHKISFTLKEHLDA